MDDFVRPALMLVLQTDVWFDIADTYKRWHGYSPQLNCQIFPKWSEMIIILDFKLCSLMNFTITNITMQIDWISLSKLVNYHRRSSEYHLQKSYLPKSFRSII